MRRPLYSDQVIFHLIYGPGIHSAVRALEIYYYIISTVPPPPPPPEHRRRQVLCCFALPHSLSLSVSFFFNFLRVQCRNFHLNRRATPAARAVLSQSLGLARGWFSFSACRFLEFASRAWIIFFSPLYMDSGALADCCFYGLKGTSPLRAKCCRCWLVLLSLDSDGKRQINKVIMQCQLYHLLKFSSRYIL